MSDRSEEDFRNILRAWHNNNGIQGFAEYFQWSGMSSIYHHLANETGESVRNLIIRDFCKHSNATGFRDPYVAEWWNIWKTRDISKVYFRSGMGGNENLYHWLLYVCNPDGVGEQE